MKRITGGIALILVLVAAGCGGEPGALPERSEPVDVAVSTAAATHGVLTAPGNLVASEEAELATRVSGTIERMAVDVGSRVSAGDSLVMLDTSDIDARIASATANARLARQYYDRIKSLAADGAATAQELDEAEARLAMAEAGLRDARAQQDYFVLRAPFPGVITARMADPGDLSVPGQPILQLIASAGVKIIADLPAGWSGRLTVGDQLTVYRPEGTHRYPARITRVVPAVERASRRFRIEARLETAPDPAIPPGAYVRIELSAPTATTRWIPADAVVSRGQLDGVFVIDGDRLRLRWIRTGQRLADAIELLAGPGPQARLVRDPAPGMVDGQPVAEVSQVDWVPTFIEQLATSTGGAR